MAMPRRLQRALTIHELQRMARARAAIVPSASADAAALVGYTFQLLHQYALLLPPPHSRHREQALHWLSRISWQVHHWPIARPLTRPARSALIGLLAANN